jgi:hypothetical protein
MMSATACAVAEKVCATCGIPEDSEFFDVSGFAKVPDSGEEVVLARFELRHQYCGVVEYFSQFTDEFAGNAAAVVTPSLQWRLLVNGRPFYPYVNVRVILNPWGFGSFPVRLRLPEAARVELSVRRDASPQSIAIKMVGGRISGRYWFNPGLLPAAGEVGDSVSPEWSAAQRAGSHGTRRGAGTGTRTLRARSGI